MAICRQNISDYHFKSQLSFPTIMYDFYGGVDFFFYPRFVFADISRHMYPIYPIDDVEAIKRTGRNLTWGS